MAKFALFCSVIALALFSFCSSGSQLMSGEVENEAGILKNYCGLKNIRSAEALCADSLMTAANMNLEKNRAKAFSDMDFAIIKYRIAILRFEIDAIQKEVDAQKQALNSDQEQLQRYGNILSELQTMRK